MQAIREALHCSSLEAVFATVHISLTQGIFLTNYVLDLGASNFECGVVESLPYLLQFCHFFSPWFVRRLEARKPVAGFFAFAHRLSWIFLILLLYVDWNPGTKQFLMILTLLGSNACAVIAHNAWFSWMTDLIPAAIRGSYYGRRNAYMGLASLVTLFLGSQLLSVFREAGMGAMGYTICFSTAIISAAFAAYMILRQYEPEPEDTPFITLVQLRETLKARPLLSAYIWFFTLWQFSLGVAAAFFGVYMVKELKMTAAEMGWFSIISSITALLGSRLWGRAMDKVGDRAVIVASGALISLHVWIWMPSHEGFLWPAWSVCFIGGFAWAGFNIAALSWPQRLCGVANRQYTFGLIGLVSGPGFVAGSLLGGVLTTYLPDVLFHIGSFRFQHYHLVFAMSAVGRGLAVLLIANWSLDHDSKHRSIWRCLVDTFRAMVK
jgi:MFS family permease